MSFEDVAKAVAGPALSAVIGGVVAYVVSRRNTHAQRRVTIDGMLNKAIELAMQYPHLERDDYCMGWPNPPGEPKDKAWQDDKERYDNYCCYIFNIVRQAWEHAGKKEKNLEEDRLTLREYILRHRCWWKHEDGNVHYYEQDFISFVNGVIDDAKRKGECK